MVTKLNTYESVPIGTSNFEDFLSYIRSFLGANFGFSTNALDNNGGYFLDDNFGWVQFGTTSPNRAWIFTPQGKPEGNLFGRKNSEYFRLLVLNAEGQLPQVNKWEALVTSVEEYTGGVALRNRVETDPITSDPVVVKPLPYRPLRVEPTFDTAPGYYDIRLNGIPQDINSATFTVDPTTSFHNQNVEFISFRLGAEFPNPVRGGRYDGSLGPSGDGFTDLLDLNDPLRYGTPMVSDPTTNLATLEFPHTNFSIDYGGHILLWNYGDRYSYIPQDISSSPDPAPGTYKVLDFARGIIKLNVTADQLDALGSFSKFTVISAEHLQESSSGGIPSYHSRYGSLYDGNASLVKLVRYTFDGLEHRAIQMNPDDISASPGSILTSDISGSFGDSVILAIEYYGTPNLAEIETVQSTRYDPDILTFFYSVGMHNHIGGSNTSNFRGLLEHNDASWYNRDVLDADYFPVPRIRNTWYSPITTVEAALWDDGVFDLNSPFAIVDTIMLQELADVPTNLNDGDILEYNSSTGEFDNTPFELKKLNDVSISQTHAPANDRNVLYYRGSTQSWSEASIPAVLGYAPVNRAGDDSISGTLEYTGAVDLDAAPNLTLITKGYVDPKFASLESAISDLEDDFVTIAVDDGLSITSSGSTRTLSVDSTVLRTTGNQPVSGVKTFANLPVLSSNPTNGNQAARKSYVDSLAGVQSISSGSGISVVDGSGPATTVAVDNTVIRTTGSQVMSSGVKTFSTNNNTLPVQISRTGNANAPLGAAVRFARYNTQNPPAINNQVTIGLAANHSSTFFISNSNADYNRGIHFDTAINTAPVIYGSSTSNGSSLALASGRTAGGTTAITLAYSTTGGESGKTARKGSLLSGGAEIAYWNGNALYAGNGHTSTLPNAFATRGYVESMVSGAGGADISNAPSSVFGSAGYVRIGDLFICVSPAAGENNRGNRRYEGPTLPSPPSGKSYKVISCWGSMVANASNYLAHSVYQTEVGNPNTPSTWRPSPRMHGNKPVGSLRVNTVSNSSGNAWSAQMFWLVVLS